MLGPFFAITAFGVLSAAGAIQGSNLALSYNKDYAKKSHRVPTGHHSGGPTVPLLVASHLSVHPWTE